MRTVRTPSNRVNFKAVRNMALTKSGNFMFILGVVMSSCFFLLFSSDSSSRESARSQELPSCGVVTFEAISVRNPDPLDPMVHGPKHATWTEEHFYRYTQQYLDAYCKEMVRAGKLEDGGWDVCISPPYQMTPDKCVVLSFGINNDFSFDDHMAEHFRCTVHSFDPSMKLETHQRSARVWFYKEGISNKDVIPVEGTGWILHTYSSILDNLNLKGDLIDVLKFDIESSDVAVLTDLLSNNTNLQNVKQMLFEYHTLPLITSSKHFKTFTDILQNVHKAGFRRYLSHLNARCVSLATWESAYYNRSRCVELYYVNKRFLGEDCQLH